MAICSLYSGCTNTAVLVWKRRMTADELAAAQAQQPDSSVTEANSYTPLYGCSEHLLTADLAAQMHASTCTSPNLANLPSCDCRPEVTPSVAEQ